MRKPTIIAVLALLSFSALAVTLEEKQERIEALEKLKSPGLTLDTEAFLRELSYDERNLTLSERAKEEVNLLAASVRQRIKLAFDKALEVSQDREKARDEIREMITTDLELAAPELRSELLEFSLTALDDLTVSGASETVSLPRIERTMLSKVKERNVFLNTEDNRPTPRKQSPSVAEKKDYKSTAELIGVLVSEGPNTNFVSSAHQSITTANATSVESKVSIQVKIEFLGANLSAGPEITFKRVFTTSANLMAEGLYPVLDGRSNFIFTNPRTSQPRAVNFKCDAQLRFTTDYSGGGEFKVAGLGNSVKGAQSFSSNVSLTSRMIKLPQSIGSQVVTLSMLTNICHGQFLRAGTGAGTTVTQSLELMMKNVVAGLSFSHPRTKCVTDAQCLKWFNRQPPSLRNKNVPRCVQDAREKFSTCELRGREGQACTLFDRSGKRITSGSYEYMCDSGLKCVQTKKGGWFRSWEIYESPEGKCKGRR